MDFDLSCDIQFNLGVKVTRKNVQLAQVLVFILMFDLKLNFMSFDICSPGVWFWV